MTQADQATTTSRSVFLKWSVILRSILAVVVLAAIIASLAFLPAQQYLNSFTEWIHGLGFWGVCIFVVVYMLVCLVLLPGSVLSVVGGFLFGLLGGIVMASLGATLGATAAFIIARVIVRDWIEHRLASHPKFCAVDRAVATQGFKIVLLVRLCSLLPYDLSSYLFGFTKISMGRYVLATWLGRLPEVFIWTYVGTTAKSLSDVASGTIELGVGRQVFLGVGVFTMMIVTLVLANVARKALRETITDSSSKDH
jgi:uncharacterized membrane protein YdjX (TVP38/TMEM64 family)